MPPDWLRSNLFIEADLFSSNNVMAFPVPRELSVMLGVEESQFHPLYKLSDCLIMVPAMGALLVSLTVHILHP